MLFNALLASISFLFFAYIFGIVPPVVQNLLSPLNNWIEPILGGPELMVESIIPAYVPGYGRWAGESLNALLLVLSALRLGAVFAWGVARLRRGKYAPYAETLWLIVICALVTIRLDSFFNDISIRFYVLQALLVMTGLVIFVIQRRRPPAWKWKMPE